MCSRVLTEAEAVAGARWEETEPGQNRKKRLQDTFLEKVGQVALIRWEATQPEPVDIQSQIANDGRSKTYCLFDKNGFVIKCHVCGKEDAWTPEQDQNSKVGMFVCEHEPIKTDRYSYRNTAIVSISRISRIEKVEL